MEIMGSDAAIRIFRKILSGNISRKGESTQQGRTVCCLLRAGSKNTAQRKHIESFLVPVAADLGVELMLLDPTLGDLSLKPVSSSTIRELVSRGDWEELRSKGLLHPSVLEALKKQTPYI